MAQAIKDNNNDVTAEKCVCVGKGNLIITDEAKLNAWKEHYQRLLNVEFSWDKNSLNKSAAVKGSAIFVTENIVTETIKTGFDRVSHACLLHKLKSLELQVRYLTLFLLFSVIDSFKWF